VCVHEGCSLTFGQLQQQRHGQQKMTVRQSQTSVQICRQKTKAVQVSAATKLAI
jgi:hypothetical protein